MSQSRERALVIWSRLGIDVNRTLHDPFLEARVLQSSWLKFIHNLKVNQLAKSLNLIFVNHLLCESIVIKHPSQLSNVDLSKLLFEFVKVSCLLLEHAVGVLVVEELPELRVLLHEDLD
jgi:hypothetical protein